MARNAEKSMAMLNRWIDMKQNIVKGVKGRRPRDVSECEQLREAEQWRGQVVREVTRKISEIQNAGMGEHRIRDLNDEINKLLREKRRWEDRIKELGGPDYKSQATKIVDSYGSELSGQGGYKYFGAAKDLPGVRELFEKETAAELPKRTRGQLYKGISPDYYGWRDEEDGELLLAEQLREAELQATTRKEWETKRRKKVQALAESLRKSEASAPTNTAADDFEQFNEAPTSEFKAYVSVPSAQEIQVRPKKELILQKRKQVLMAKYLSSNQQEQQTEAKELLGKVTDAPTDRD